MKANAIPIPPHQEGREEVPEVVALHRQPRVEHKSAGAEQQPGHERHAQADSQRHQLRDVREYDDRERQRDVRDAVWIAE
jgi:hypothetical protein